MGEGRNTRDRYFIIPSPIKTKTMPRSPPHSFITVIRVLADTKQPRLTPGLTKRSYKNRDFEA